MSVVFNCCCFACIPQDKAAIIEQCGKFDRVGSSGCNVVICCIGECITGTVSLRIDQLDVQIETKTKDNVFVQAVVSVQYEVQKEKTYEAYYKLTNPKAQITAYVFDVVRSTVPKIILDDVFDSKDMIASAVKNELSKIMPSYGYNILQTLVTDLSPDLKVKNAMNEINAAQRIRQAATDKAEAEKILAVKAAEADAESKYLQGMGISRQRQAIVGGLQESVVSFTGNVGGISAKDVLEIMMMTQYFDMMKDLGEKSASNCIFIPHSPSTVNDISGQLRNAFIQGNVAVAKQ